MAHALAAIHVAADRGYLSARHLLPMVPLILAPAGFAAVHAGHFSDAGRIVTRTVKEWSGGKEATLIPSGERTAVHYALAARTLREDLARSAAGAA